MEATYIELAGWGGGPGCIASVMYKGPMTVTLDESLGLLVLTAGTGVTRKWGWGDNKAEVQEGSQVRFHASAVREMK